MKKLIQQIVNNGYAFSLAVYASLSLVFFWFYSCRIDPDGISYIEIAKFYANGDWENAINAYWSPLISWILTPFVYLSFPMPETFRFLLVFVGFGVIYEINQIQKLVLNLKSLFKTFFFCALSIKLSHFSLLHTSPDLLSVWLLLVIFRVYLKKDFSLKNALFVGVLAGVAYYAKAYNFPFLAALFVVVFLVFRKKISRKFFIIQFSIFLGLAITWGSILSTKYDGFLLSSGGNYNLAKASPIYQHEHPMLVDGLLSPTSSQHYSVWQDPTFLADKLDWHPFQSLGSFKYWLMHVVLQNFINYLSSLNVFHAVALIFLLLSFFSKEKMKFYEKLLLIISLLYPSGYLLIVIEERYTFFLDLLMMYYAFYKVQLLLPYLNKLQTRVLAFVMLASFTILPIKNYGAYVMNYAYKVHKFKEIGVALKPMLQNAKVANLYGYDDWHYSLYVGWYADAQNYGMLKDYKDWKEAEDKLKKHKIQYVMSWKNQSPPEDWKVVYSDELVGFKVYRIN